MKKLSILMLFSLCGTAFAQTKPALVKTANGTLQGVDSAGIQSFKGVPFAQPPVGQLRWKEPQSPKNWTGIRKADHFSAQAMQERSPLSDMVFRSAGRSEDCLYLNVWTPSDAAGKKLPVLVYFYGGGFVSGDGSEYRYDGESLARKGIVAVTVNYRLGVFGFMAHPELTKESPHHASGNYGLMDQHAALVWVQKNIAAFGGDPAHVTIAGESAGSMSVSAQVASPLSKGLFAAAIAESGAVLGNLAPISLSDAEQNGVKFAEKIKHTTLAELRAIPADSLSKMGNDFHTSTDIDGYFLPQSPQATMEKGEQMHVPLLAGWNSAEIDYRFAIGFKSPTVDNYKAALQQRYGARADEALKNYPAATDSEVMKSATALASDGFIVYATWKFAELQNATSGKPVYRYMFARKRPVFADGRVNDKQVGAAHASEIEFALGNLATNKVYNWTTDDYWVSGMMENYFANFIKTFNPNGFAMPNWSPLKPNDPNSMVIDLKPGMQPVVNNDRYHFLESMMKK